MRREGQSGGATQRGVLFGLSRRAHKTRVTTYLKETKGPQRSQFSDCAKPTDKRTRWTRKSSEITIDDDTQDGHTLVDSTHSPRRLEHSAFFKKFTTRHRP